MARNKKIESILYIGKNGSGKTKCLEEIKKSKERKLKITWENKNENIIFIPTELLYDRELNDERTYLRDNYANKIKKLIEKIFGNLNQFNIELEEKYLNKKENIKKFKSEVNDFFKNIQKEDEDFIFNINFISIKKIYPLNLKLESKHKSSAGLSNYSLIKVLSELLKFAVEKNKKINNLDKYYLIIDEPEKFCHPQLIKKIALHLKNINKYINLIISTHSSIFFNWFIDDKKTKIRILKNSENCKEFTWKELIKETNIIIKDDFELYSDIKDKKAEYRRLNALFNNKILRSQIINSFFSYRIILVEGDADELLLNLIIKERNFSIVKVLGKFNFIFFSKIFEYLGFIKKNIFIIYDKDEDKIKYNENYKKNETSEKEKLESEKRKHEKINNEINKYFCKENIIYVFKNNLEKDFQIELNRKIKNEKSSNLWIYENYKKIEKSKIIDEIEKKLKKIEKL